MAKVPKVPYFDFLVLSNHPPGPKLQYIGLLHLRTKLPQPLVQPRFQLRIYLSPSSAPAPFLAPVPV
jgi:hypothetical protein